MSSEITSITLFSAATGRSEVLPSVSSTSTVADLLQLAQALLGANDNESSSSSLELVLNAKPLQPTTLTLEQAGVSSGDMLVLQPRRNSTNTGITNSTTRNASSTSTTTSHQAPVAAAGGMLDFSSLLASASNPSATTNAANNTTTTTTTTPPVVYYPSMDLNEAMAHNPHPAAIVQLLHDKEHLWKELRYHNPKLATSLANEPNLQKRQDLWRQNAVQGSIQAALKQTTLFHEQRTMQARLQANPNDPQAKAWQQKQENQQLIQHQYQQMMQEYPESLSPVLMLYVPAQINGHAIQAFVDSGAQMTIMSKALAQKCQLLELVDERFQGTATGVGTGKILGRIHLVQLAFVCNQQQYFFPCTITVMDDPPPGAKEMPFLLGLDMMKRHLCQIDLAAGVLRFDGSSSSSTSSSTEAASIQVAFLHEKDLSKEQGGTQGFNADEANAMLLEEEEDGNSSGNKK